MTKAKVTTVRKNQVWRDADKRRSSRSFKVKTVTENHVMVVNTVTGRSSVISKHRFNNRNYTIVK